METLTLTLTLTLTQALSTLSKGEAQLQAARRPSGIDRGTAAGVGSVTAALAAAAAAAATESVLLTRAPGHASLSAPRGGRLQLVPRRPARQAGVAPAAGDGVGASDPRRDYAQRCAWGAKCRGM